MRTFQALLCAIVLSVSVVAPATAKDHPTGQLDMFSARVDAATAARLTQAGYDISDSARQRRRDRHPHAHPVAPGTRHAPQGGRQHRGRPRRQGPDLA